MEKRSWFCKCRDEETGVVCKKLLRDIDDVFVSNYGMCSDCFLKYNNHLPELKERITEITGEK